MWVQVPHPRLNSIAGVKRGIYAPAVVLEEAAQLRLADEQLPRRAPHSISDPLPSSLSRFSVGNPLDDVFHLTFTDLPPALRAQ
jgi:hypothetical protein